MDRKSVGELTNNLKQVATERFVRSLRSYRFSDVLILC